MYENINIKYDNCCIIDGIYYYIDIDLNALISKSAGGNILYTYPIFLQLTTAPIKFDFDGVYFFSLHLENNRNLVRKWRIINYTLDFIQDFDYSSIGVLATPTISFRKHFNMPPEYDDWVSGYLNASNAYFTTDRAELVVGSYGSYSGWRGPWLEKDFPTILDFKLETKFYFTSNGATDASNTRTYMYLRHGADSVYLFLFDRDSIWLWDNGTYVLNNKTHYLINNGYNYVELKRYDSQLEFTVNDVLMYRATTSNNAVNRFRLLAYQYYTAPAETFRINRIYLTGYTNEHIIDTTTLVIDSYKSTVASGIPAGSDYIELAGETDFIDSGTLLFLGDTNSNTYEEVTVTGTLGPNKYGLNFFTYFDHNTGDDVSFSKNMYMFNNYRRKDPGGSIYKLNYVTGHVEDTFDSDNYIDIDAACFFQVDDTYLCGYVSNTNFISLDIHDDMSLFEVMNVENVDPDQITVIPITDIEVVGDSLYRIQKRASYYGTKYNWSNYNYQLTPINSFIDSTTIEAVPLIMSADGISTIDVTTLAKDQYAEEIQFIRVKFYDDDDVGYMTIQDTYTGLTGKAQSFYKSGIDPREVLLSTEIIQE